jgi:hypothetical protein
MLASVTHVLPVAAIRRERLMSTEGRIIARRGQQVSPSDIVAEAVLRPEHLLLDIGLGLGLSPKEADQYIQRRAGDEIGEGDVIAGPVGIGRRVVRAPKSGIVVVAGGGQVLMELEGEFSELKAGYSGVVAEIVGDRGVIIETTGSLIQGVWGNGKINYGLLNILAHDPDELITSDMMNVSLRGAVVMAGYCEDEKVLISAEETPIRGMILASMASSLVPAALSVNYPIVLVEGFGKLPMNMEAFSVLSLSSRNEVALNAESWNRIGNTRPEIVVSTSEGAFPEVPTELASFAIGQTVRVVSPPYKSMLGTLTNLPQSLSRLPSGLLAKTAEIKLSNGETVLVPLANLEIIG